MVALHVSRFALQAPSQNIPPEFKREGEGGFAWKFEVI
jgi:hypothetical protein